METNHWSITSPADIAESGSVPCQALLNMGNNKFSWEKYDGYPTNLICGDFRISVRALGSTPGERRLSRERIWNERNNFSILERELIDPETTLARVGYSGESFPLEFAFCLRMRQRPIKSVTVDDQEIPFEIFEDRCSVFVHIPIIFERAGKTEITIKHAST
jgi:hypothetical protein